MHFKPVIAQLVEHLTVDMRSHQMVPGSIPGVRIFVRRVRIDAFNWFVQMRLAIIFILASQKLPRRAQNGGANVSRAVRMCVFVCAIDILDTRTHAGSPQVRSVDAAIAQPTLRRFVFYTAA